MKAAVVGKMEKESTALFATARLWDDGLIDPRDSRRVLAPVPVDLPRSRGAPAQAQHVRRRADVGKETPMEFTQEHEGIRRNVKKFIDTEINPHVDEWEEAGIFPAHELFKKMGDQGYLGINKPTKYGGMGLDYSYQLVFLETLGHIRCGGVPMAIGVQTDMATPALARFGSDELCKEFLVPVDRGRLRRLPRRVRGRRRLRRRLDQDHRAKDGDDYVINGGKMWTTSGTQADWMCLLANTGDGPAHKNKSLICVPMKTKGVQIARKLDKLGMRSSDTAQIFFEDVRVPQRNRIGEEGVGFIYQMLQFQEERL